MASRMLAFVDVPGRMPQKRAAENRRADFGEIYREYAAQRAAEQAARCSQCGVPACQTHCPLHNNIPDWLKLVAENRLEEAYEVSQATNTFPEICGRICPQDRLCEGNCVIEKSGHGTVTIGAIERYITEQAWENGWVRPPAPPFERNKSVGIVGAGPAGLAAADSLRRKGYSVRVYDRHDRAGGLLIYGIPNFKLDKVTVQRRVAELVEGGVDFRLNCDVGSDIGLDEVRGAHDAVLLATGVYSARDLGGPGSGLGGIVQAIDYLTASNRKGLGDRVDAFDVGTLDARGKHVAVIGGGDTAMDCVRTAVRQGAASVRCLYGATAKTCRARGGKSRMPRKRVSFSSGFPLRKRSWAKAVSVPYAPGGCGSEPRTGPDAERRNPSRMEGSTSRPVSWSRRSGSIRRTMPGDGARTHRNSRAGEPCAQTSVPARQVSSAYTRPETLSGAPRLSSGPSATGARQPQPSTGAYRPPVQ